MNTVKLKLYFPVSLFTHTWVTMLPNLTHPLRSTCVTLMIIIDSNALLMSLGLLLRVCYTTLQMTTKKLFHFLYTLEMYLEHDRWWPGVHTGVWSSLCWFNKHCIAVSWLIIHPSQCVSSFSSYIDKRIIYLLYKPTEMCSWMGLWSHHNTNDTVWCTVSVAYMWFVVIFSPQFFNMKSESENLMWYYTSNSVSTNKNLRCFYFMYMYIGMYWNIPGLYCT